MSTKCEVAEVADQPGVWAVTIEGTAKHQVLFSGPESQEWAAEYAAWKMKTSYAIERIDAEIVAKIASFDSARDVLDAMYRGLFPKSVHLPGEDTDHWTRAEVLAWVKHGRPPNERWQRMLKPEQRSGDWSDASVNTNVPYYPPGDWRAI